MENISEKLSDIIKVCRECEVEEFSIDGCHVYVSFKRGVSNVYNKSDLVQQISSGHLPEKNDTIVPELARQDDLDDLLISDPLEYENQIRFEDNEKPGK